MVLDPLELELQMVVSSYGTWSPVSARAANAFNHTCISPVPLPYVLTQGLSFRLELFDYLGVIDQCSLGLACLCPSPFLISLGRRNVLTHLPLGLQNQFVILSLQASTYTRASQSHWQIFEIFLFPLFVVDSNSSESSERSIEHFLSPAWCLGMFPKNMDIFWLREAAQAKGKTCSCLTSSYCKPSSAYFWSFFFLEVVKGLPLPRTKSSPETGSNRL